jgi:CRISPR/Cas system-associated endoribonuclease Cas2
MSYFTPEQSAKVSARICRELTAWLQNSTVEPHFSAAKTAELLDVTVRTIWNYVDAGERSEGREGN